MESWQINSIVKTSFYGFLKWKRNPIIGVRSLCITVWYRKTWRGHFLGRSKWMRQSYLLNIRWEVILLGWEERTRDQVCVLTIKHQHASKHEKFKKKIVGGKEKKNIKLRKFYSLTTLFLGTESLDLVDTTMIWRSSSFSERISKTPKIYCSSKWAC